MKNELKPCPFCGNTQGNGMGIRFGTDKVYCRCGALVPAQNWNSRPIEDMLQREIDNLYDDMAGESI